MLPVSELPVERSLAAGPRLTLSRDGGEIIRGMTRRVPILIRRECQRAPETVRFQIGRNPKLGARVGPQSQR